MAGRGRPRSLDRRSWPLEHLRLLGARLAALASEARDLWPALDEAVVGERVGGALLPLADRVESVGQLARSLGLASKFGDELRR